jgi:outer membrane protein TolC
MRIVALLALALALQFPSSPGAQAPDTLYLGLDEAIQMALAQGPEAALARQDVALAEAQKGIVFSNALTQIFLSAAYKRNVKRPVIFFPDETGKTRSIEIGEKNDYQATLSLRQPLFSSGRLGAAYKASKLRADAAGLLGDAQASQIALRVREAYFNCLLAQAQVEIAAKSLEQAREHLDDVTKREARGLASRFDVLRARVEVSNREPLVTRTRHLLRLSLDSLKDLVGIPLDRPVVLTDSLGFRPDTTSLEVAIRKALERRPELRAARREVDAARSQFKAQAANDRPLLYLDANYTWLGQTSERLLPRDQETAQSASIGLTLEWPLLDGFRNRYATRQALVAAERAGIQLRRLENAVRLETRAAWQEVRERAEELRAREETVGLAQEAYRLARIRYRNGLSTQLEVLDAEVALTQARLARLQALYDYEMALARLHAAMGEGPPLTAAASPGHGTDLGIHHGDEAP